MLATCHRFETMALESKQRKSGSRAVLVGYPDGHGYSQILIWFQERNQNWILVLDPGRPRIGWS
jgi:hypothetical protein